MDGGNRQRLAGFLVQLLRQVGFECLGLLNMEFLEIQIFGRFLKVSNGRRHLVNAAWRFAFGLFQIGEIGSLDALVLAVEFRHGFMVFPSDHLNRVRSSQLGVRVLGGL